MQHECKYDVVIDMMRDDVKDIKRDVKELLGFKYKLAGAIVLGSFLISAAISYFTKLIIAK